MGLLWRFNRIKESWAHSQWPVDDSKVSYIKDDSFLSVFTLTSVVSYPHGTCPDRLCPSIACDVKMLQTWPLLLWSEALIKGGELSTLEQLGSVICMHGKLETGLRENCFGDKEVVILAFWQPQFTDGTERTFLSTPITDTFQLFSAELPLFPTLSANISLRYIFSP